MSFLSSAANSIKSQARAAAKNAAAGLLSAARGQLSAFGVSAPLGSFGEIVFEVSSRKILTFKDYKRKTQARYASHEIVGLKPILEYLGPGGEEITLSMEFNVNLGTVPADEADKVRMMCETGETNYLVIGNTPIGANKWVITDVGENADVIDNNGRIIKSKIDVTFKEYVEEAGGAA